MEFIKSAYSVSEFPPARLPEIVFAGRSNAGKSSIINAVSSRHSLVKVSSMPGFTQTINFFLANERIFFVDLPGYGFAKAPKEIQVKWKTLIEQYLKSRRNIKTVVCIFDIRRMPDQMDIQLLDYLSALRINALVVLNKADKLSQPKRTAQIKTIMRALPSLTETPLLTSARTGEGIDTLRRRILDLG
ncbi:ribosome biogenesis GTP-binding protein YihA/YsxC [Dissulfurimicrobium hydrothermale]|nr:ribosome biogenesis GTP-binding protein YihA/YsxC [Dissulfurimicrobium hydrothermale]